MVVLRNVPQLTRNLGAVPPPLPPSVEEAYRRKCIQLKQRMNEVEEANDASRQRVVRMERSIQKMRLERAFLLEQLSKRTSTNVEDSEGSPSPPPTVCQTPACA
jgi:non-histone protein 10